ncbi:hypothetical protein ACOALA_20630 (plasmid) [Alicyclobacillus acidoterrestris]|uniref:hypothetical protein n=1 Tax=Alicyclobacillus acidoterrestris TaxID=1450 RepID=UPI003F53D570
MSFFRKAYQQGKKVAMGASVLLMPYVARAATSGAGPGTIDQGVSDAESLVAQAATWAFELIAAGAAVFLIRAWFVMHSADDDGQYAKGRKHLMRSIFTLIGAGCTTAIIATVRQAFGF